MLIVVSANCLFFHLIAETAIKANSNRYGGNMREDIRGSANRRAQSRSKARLVLCLFSLFVISLTGLAPLSAKSDPLTKNGDGGAQSDGAPSISSLPQDPKPDWWAINRAIVNQLSVNDLGEVIKSLPPS